MYGFSASWGYANKKADNDQAKPNKNQGFD